MKSVFGAESSRSFESALDSAKVVDDAAPAQPPYVGNPLGGVSVPLGSNPAPARGGDWERLYEDVEESGASQDLELPLIMPETSVDAIRRELALELVSGLPELLKLRREFMWRNHPDRWPEIAKSAANARVAIANMLIDQTLKKFQKA